ncbi:MAG: InlB B-repeat-containing protein, partial [Rhodoluna sp.]
MPTTFRRLSFRMRNGIKAVTALILATVLSVSGLQYQANALTVSNGNCSANVNVTTSVSVFAEGNYCYVAFKGTASSYQWTPPAGLTSIDLLVVAGGGGGASRHAGGGGAGGLIQRTGFALSGNTVNVTVGAGGAATWEGSNGSDSLVSSMGITTQTAKGGGGGGSSLGGSLGGSGGGANCCNTTAGAGTAGQGNAGSTGWYSSSYWLGGAGGGAGAAGTAANGSSFVAGIGGSGAAVSWITTAAQSALGVGQTVSSSVYFAGGGGGGTAAFGSSGSGGNGGGGKGGKGVPPNNQNVADLAFAGTANTGGGGGGGGMVTDNTSLVGGAGGSGVVVLRYVPPVYSVTFNNNGGSGTIADQSVASGSALTLTSNTFTRTGYTFTGWNTAANGTGTSYTNGQSVTLTASTSLYAMWATDLMAYEPFTGSINSNLVGGTGSGSSGLTGSWILVKAEKADSVGISNTYTSVPTLALPSNTSFTLPSSNTGASVANWVMGYSARELTTQISFDTAGTYYYSFINHMPTTSSYGGMGMLGLLSGLPATNSDTTPWSLFTGSAYVGKFAIDYGNANRATWVTGQTRGSSDAYSAVGTKSSYPTTATTANFVLVKVVTSASGNDQISLRAFAPSETMPLDDSTITWDVQYATAITGSATHVAVQTEWYGVLDEFRIGYTYKAVTGAQTIYTVTYSYDSATGGNSTTSANFSVGGTALTLPTPTKTGYTFGGWYSEVGLTNQVGLAGASYSPTSTGTLYAKWTKNSNTVTFDSNGGAGSSTTQSILTDTATALISNTFTRLGYMFSNWNTIGLGGGTSYTNGQSVTINGPINLYAQWTANSNTVTFNSNSGSGTMANQSITTDQATALTANTFTRTGYSFAGWNTAANGSGTAYSNSQSVTLNAALSVYAQWTANSNTLTFNNNGGSGTMASQSITTDQATALTSNSFTKTGYSFSGWNTAANGSGTAYSNSQTVTLNTAVSLFAQWSANTNSVTFNNNTGSGTMASQSITTDLATALTTNTFTKTGYTFAGWNTAANGSGTSYSNSQSVTLNAALTLYAQWSASTNTVTFNANDGSGSPATSTQNIVSGTSTALSANSFTRTGHTFSGWNTAANGSGTAYANSASVTILSSTTLYAQWTAVTYTVTYNKNGASGNAERASESYTYGSTAITLPTIGSMTKTGYTFDGWSETNGGSKISGTYTPSASITLYARWVAASFSITYNDNAATSGSPSATSGSYTTGGTAISLATQSTMARTGYTFAGWSTTINDSTTRINNSGSYTITAPVILYALWTAVDYSVTYSTQGSTSGAAPTDSTVFHIGDTAVIKANTGALVKTGYTFAGWTVASDGSGTVLTSGDTVAIASSNVTLYPKWTANTYTVTLNVNGASGAPAGYSSGSSPFTESYTSGTSGLTLAAVGTMVKTGYDFAGWSTTPSGGAITNTGFTTSTDKTLYAVWNLKSINYTYFRGTAGGTQLTGSHIANFPTLSAQSGLYGSVINLDTTVDPTITVGADGYQFMGWNDGNSIYSKGDAFTLGSSAATFTAEWVRLYEVRYAKNGGTGVVDVDPECAQAGNTCLANQNITLHVAPSRPGYTFTGWKDQSNQAFAAGAAATITNTSYLFYAQWQAINYTMAFNAQGGSTSPAQLTKNISDTFTLPSPGTKTGYTFSGWFDGTNTYGVGANYTVGTASKTFAALWTADVYTVTYNWNGGTGTSVPDVNYTYGSSAITLPTGSTHTRDGYTFAGWATSQGGSAISGGFTPTADTLLYARWVDGSYTVTLNAHGGTLTQSSYSVSRGSSITLPAPTRTGFTFDGWYEDSATTLVAGQANTSFAPTATATLHAKWVQNSLAGVNPAHINSLTSITVTGAHTWSGTHSASGTGASLSIPNGALPNGTVVKVSFIEDLTRPRNIIDSSYAYYSSVIVHWLTGTGDSATVPAT